MLSSALKLQLAVSFIWRILKLPSDWCSHYFLFSYWISHVYSLERSKAIQAEVLEWFIYVMLQYVYIVHRFYCTLFRKGPPFLKSVQSLTSIEPISSLSLSFIWYGNYLLILLNTDKCSFITFSTQTHYTGLVILYNLSSLRSLT